MTQLAIIGAGPAGLAAARALRRLRPDLTITLYEKSRGVGGRAATRRRNDWTFDHGAQLFKTPSPALEQLVLHELPADELFDLLQPVWVFDAAGTISVGDPALNAEPKWVYRDGINRLGKLLADGLDVRREVRITALRRDPHDRRRQDEGGPFRAPWQLFDTSNAYIGTADAVLLTAPAPQAAEIVAASDLDTPLRDRLLAGLQAARYRRCLSLTLAFARPLERPFYALVNTDRQHPMAWLALEHCKGAQRGPNGQSLLIAQMAAAFSLQHWDMPPKELTLLVLEHLQTLLQEDLGAPLWHDLQRWRYALPDAPADLGDLNGTEGLYFAGDALAGQGRIHLAIESGWLAAEAIANNL